MRTRLYHGGLYKPREAEAHQNIEDIAAHGVAHCHVTETFFYDRQRGESIRHTHASGDKGQAHYSVGDAESASYKVIALLSHSIRFKSLLSLIIDLIEVIAVPIIVIIHTMM